MGLIFAALGLALLVVAAFTVNVSAGLAASGVASLAVAYLLTEADE